MHCFDKGITTHKPHKTLQIQLNVLIDKGCEGCNFCEFPYSFRGIIRENGKLPDEHIDDVNGVWDYITRLSDESIELKKGNVLDDVYEQLPFFTCVNHILDEEIQKDIQRYIFCSETNTPVYPGSYGEQPSVWISKYFIIKQSLEMRMNKLKGNKNGN